MIDQSIAESAIYQETVKLAEKYKAQRDELIKYLHIMVDIGSEPRVEHYLYARVLLSEVEQSL